MAVTRYGMYGGPRADFFGADYSGKTEGVPSVAGSSRMSVGISIAINGFLLLLGRTLLGWG